MDLLKKKKNLLVLFIAFLISIFFLEIISDKIRKNRISSDFIVPHHTLHHAWKKNLQSTHKYPKYEIITNSNGWLQQADAIDSLSWELLLGLAPPPKEYIFLNDVNVYYQERIWVAPRTSPHNPIS